MKTTRLALAGLLTILASVDAARGAQIQVTMKNDVVADDGRCSLREAIDAANNDSPSGREPGECIAGERVPVVDVIRLRRGIYRLKRGAAGDDLNVGGDLDVTESVVIQGKGRKTIIRNGIGDPGVAGDGDRLFHVDPGAAGGVDATFSKLTLAGGDVSCSGDACDPGASAVDNRGSGALTFASCLVMRNSATCFGDGCGTGVSGAAIGSVGGGAVAIRGTTIKKNASRCATRGCAVGPAAVVMTADDGAPLVGAQLDDTAADFILDDSTITQNASRCDGNGCGAGGAVAIDADGDVAVRRVKVALNTSRCTGADCGAYGILGVYGEGSAVAADVDVVDNVSGCAGVDCYVGGTLYVASSNGAALRGAVLRANPASCDGADCDVDSRYVVYGLASAVVESVAASLDTLSCSGEECEIDPLLQVVADGPVDVVDVQLSENELVCVQKFCEVGTIASWRGGQIRTLRTEVAANRTGCTGDECRLRPLLELDATGDSTIDGQTVNGNDALCTGRSCTTSDAVAVVVEDGDLTVAKPTLEANELLCAGERCETGDFLDAYVDGAIAFREASLSSNVVRCDGAGCRSGGVGVLQSSNLDFTDAIVRDNVTACAGSGCRGLAILRLLGGDAAVEGSLFTENRVTCDGEDCATGTGGALRNQSTRLHISDSELSANATDGFGGAIFNDARSELILEQVSIVRNEAGLRGVMEFGGFGGGVYNDASNGAKGVLTLIDTEIRRNRSLRNGGGILNEGAIARLVNAAITDNDPTDCFDQGGSGCP